MTASACERHPNGIARAFDERFDCTCPRPIPTGAVEVLRAENARLREALADILGPDPASPHAEPRSLAEGARLRAKARAALATVLS